jgi:hypothetical protein
MIVSFSNQAVGTTSAAQAVTLSNTSDVTATIAGVAIAGANSGDFAVADSCGSSLPGRASCTMSVTFTPSAGGSRTSTLAMTVDEAAQSVALSGVGVAAGIALYPPSLTFGNQPVNTSSVAQTVTLTNTGTSPLTITSITAGGDFAQTNNYTGVVMPATSCTIGVTFTPTGRGQRTGTLTIIDSSPASPQTVGLAGVGAQPAVTLSPTNLVFGVAAVGGRATQTVTLTNSGTAPLTIIDVGIAGADSGDFFYTLSAGSTLAPGQSSQISVTFVPSTGGSRSAQLTITDDAAGSPHSVNLTGSITGPAITVSPSTLTFARQAIGTTSPAQGATLTNSGGAPLTISSIAASGDFAQTNNYAAPLAPGASCTINVTFKPTGGGTRTGTVMIVDSAPDSPHTVSLTGAGPYSETYEFFYQDDRRTYYVSLPQGSAVASAAPAGASTAAGAASGDAVAGNPGSGLSPGRVVSNSLAGVATAATPPLQFNNHFHPHICAFIAALDQGGLSGLLTLANQVLTNDIVKDHFYTTSGTEHDNAVSQFGYLSEGVACYVYQTQIAGTIPFYRLRSPLGDHFYTSAAAERKTLLAEGWGDDGIACYLAQSQNSGTEPLYRLYSPNLNIHFYTSSLAEKKLAIASGYNDEGIPGYVFSVPAAETVPLYRLLGLYTVFEQKYFAPNTRSPYVSIPYPPENVDFSYGGAYSLYNWELFFHIPLLIATRLAANQQFEDAQRWFHYIFDPTQGDNQWRVLPFQTTEKDRIEALLRLLEYAGSDPNIIQARNALQNQLNEWVHNPFDPYNIARLRLIAFQKAVVMEYLDALISWGDQLFRQNEREPINQATQLYVMAQEILGPRPQLVPSRDSAQDQTYNDLKSKLDDFSNVLVQLENDFPFSTGPAANAGGGGPGLTGTFYFCTPHNDQLLAYWDRIADRLFKIRHCMTIDGVVRQLPLFAPPLPPGLLVRAAAQGVDLASAFNDIDAVAPYYRFSFMLQKAFELCAEVKTFGSALLSALEKKDSEYLSLLRATQESGLLQAALQVKKSQLTEANDNLAGLQASQRLVQFRQQYYQNLIDTSPSAFENSQISELKEAQNFQGASQIVNLAASAFAIVPNFNIGVSGISSPVATFIFGGANLSKELELVSRVLADIASLHSYHANMASITGAWDRRSQEWNFQVESATRELEQIQSQIEAATVRAQIAQTEIDNQNTQIRNARTVEDVLRSKFTSQDLYAWMIAQTSQVFFQCYQLAYDMAKRAEKAFRFERGLGDSSFITFGYWDNLKKGLLSGEQLYLDLKRLEMADLDQNKRDYEISKRISLVLTAPMGLIALKEIGHCTLDLPEALFDADYPGHFMRRVKSVSLTIPCVTGPYTSVNCTLSLLKNSARVSSAPTGNEGHYTRDVHGNDPRFVDDFAAIQSIATSSGQNDSGMFEVNFRDERYLPFEGAGVISSWQLRLPKDTNAFDFETISDVILNVNYTARDGGVALRQAARGAAASQPPAPASRLFSLKHEFPTDWYKFLSPPGSAASQALTLALGIERFPFLYRGRTIKITRVDLYLRFKDIYDSSTYRLDPSNPTPLGDYAKGTALTMYVTPAPGTAAAAVATLQSAPSYLNGLPHAALDSAGQPGALGSWLLEARGADIHKIAASLQTTVTADTATHYRLKPELIEDIILVCTYQVQ